MKVVDMFRILCSINVNAENGKDRFEQICQIAEFYGNLVLGIRFEIKDVSVFNYRIKHRNYFADAKPLRVPFAWKYSAFFFFSARRSFTSFLASDGVNCFII